MILEPDIGQCVSEEAELEGGGHDGMCQQGRWTFMGMDWGVYIDWRRERVIARTLGPE